MGEGLTGRVAVVTRDVGGIGEAAAAALAAEGATVVVAEAGDEAVATVAATIRAHGALHVLHLSTTDGAEAWCAAAAGPMGEAGGGSIITTATTRALAGDLTGSAEACAGGAVIALTRSVATEHGKRGVRANCIVVAPADLDDALLTQSTLIDRGPRPDDSAATVAYLASDDASFVTGQVIRCDGGLLAHLPHYASLQASGATTAGGRG